MAEGMPVFVATDARKSPRKGDIKRQKPLQKSRRPRIKRTDTDSINDNSDDEFFDANSCDRNASPIDKTSDANGKAHHLTVRRKTEPGWLAPPLKHKSSRKRHSTGAVAVENEAIERIRQETRLVVIEYLSNLPADELRARERNVVKAQSIQFGEKPPWIPRKRTDSDLKRSSSDAGYYRVEMKKKLESMAAPLRRMRSVSTSTKLLHDIQHFDKKSLKQLKHKDSKASRYGLTLPVDRVADEDRHLSAPSPETRVVQNLDKISKEILQDFPELLSGPLIELLTPIDTGNELSYDAFAAAAKHLFNKQFDKFTGSGAMWSKIALIFYLVREVVLMEHVNDTQLEMLVEYASKFVAENMYEWVTKKGSLDGVEFEEDVLKATGSLFDSLDSDDFASLGMGNKEEPEKEEEPSLTSQISGYVNEWVTYGVAALAVGIGFAYNYFKQ